MGRATSLPPLRLLEGINMPRGTSAASAASKLREDQRDAVIAQQGVNSGQETVSAPPPVIEGTPATPTSMEALAQAISSILPGMVEAAVNKAMAANAPAHGNMAVQRKTEYSVEAPQHVFKKTYRCDTMPALRIQRLDMAAARAEGVPHNKKPIPGEYIEFYNGLFSTDDDDVIEQLTWSMTHVSNTGGMQGKTIGGNPWIYEVSGGSILRCPHPGCQFAATTQVDIDGHYRASHQS